MDFLTIGAGAIAGAVSTTLISNFFARPRLKTRVIRAGIEALQSYDEEAIRDDTIESRKAKHFFVVNPEVRSEFRESAYLRTPEKYYDHPQMYTSFLYQVNHDNEMALLANRQLLVAVAELQKLLQLDDYHAFLNLFAEHSSFLWSTLEGSYRRREFDVDTSINEAEETWGDLTLVSDDDGDFFVGLGLHNIPLIWSNVKVHIDRSQRFAKRLAFALACKHVDFLEQTLRYLGANDLNIPHLEHLSKTIDRELYMNSRILVRGVVINRGKSSACLDGAAKLAVRPKGKSILVDNEAIDLPDELVFDVQLLESNNISAKRSLTVDGGSATTFLAASTEYVYETGHAQKLRAIMEEGCELEITLIDQDEVNHRAKSSIKQSV